MVLINGFLVIGQVPLAQPTNLYQANPAAAPRPTPISSRTIDDYLSSDRYIVNAWNSCRETTVAWFASGIQDVHYLLIGQYLCHGIIAEIRWISAFFHPEAGTTCCICNTIF
jgi:hypothetical protein